MYLKVEIIIGIWRQYGIPRCLLSWALLQNDKVITNKKQLDITQGKGENYEYVWNLNFSIVPFLLNKKDLFIFIQFRYRKLSKYFNFCDLIS